MTNFAIELYTVQCIGLQMNMRLNTLIPKVETLVSDARIAWKALHGIFAIYKPAAVTYPNTRSSIICRLCEG